MAAVTQDDLSNFKKDLIDSISGAISEGFRAYYASRTADTVKETTAGAMKTDFSAQTVGQDVGADEAKAVNLAETLGGLSHVVLGNLGRLFTNAVTFDKNMDQIVASDARQHGEILKRVGRTWSSEDKLSLSELWGMDIDEATAWKLILEARVNQLEVERAKAKAGE